MHDDLPQKIKPTRTRALGFFSFFFSCLFFAVCATFDEAAHGGCLKTRAGRQHADAAVNQAATCCFLLAAFSLLSPPHFAPLGRLLSVVRNPPARMNEARADGAVLIGGRLDAEGREAHCSFEKKKKKFSPLPLFPRLSEPADVSGAVTFNCCECDSDVRVFLCSVFRRGGGG